MAKKIALEARLKNCKNVITLGVRPNFSAYSPRDAELIRKAEKIYYPTTFYADLFDAAGKKTFPSYHTYKCVQDKIRQTALFNLLEIQHPRTRVFYGNRQKNSIPDHFQFPFIAKIPRGSAMGRGVYLIQNRDDLSAFCDLTTTAYIQEYLPIDRDMRVVVVGNKIVHAYWRIAAPGEFRTNIAAGGTVCLDPVPQKALNLALHTASACQWDDVGIDICENDGKFYVIEANMKYGKEGFRKAGINYIQMMEHLIENGEI
ncbi:ATP-grasp domain-containing protein [Desulfonema magnum]|uniref:RimK-like ATP-grasp domain-containing protein n=1 Tax=Desulfonema magnum TaxID=45655 RepID=A0A975GSR4_9BACT|nr:RimK family alpha-L-glutamate ligase [Desulfonema magnum]QTA92187.1 RimK-like ATP-grasp domain-containing protein [Desulfonema magnum]